MRLFEKTDSTWKVNDKKKFDEIQITVTFEIAETKEVSLDDRATFLIITVKHEPKPKHRTTQLESHFLFTYNKRMTKT